MDALWGNGRNSAKIRAMNQALTYPTARHFLISPAFSHVVLRWLAALGIVLSLLGGWSSRARAQEDLSQLSPEGERAAELINQMRANAGLPPLRVHPLLTLAANLHILDMTTSGVYGHYGSDGSSVRTRVARTGYVANGWSGENWAVSTTVDKSIEWWMTDPPHRDNVLGRGYTEMGIGTAPHPKGWGLILVVDFSMGGPSEARPDNSQTMEVQAAAPAPINATPVSDSGLRYTVQPGDSLFTIGQRYGVNWQSVAQLNGLGERTILQIGMEVRIPGSGGQQPAVTQQAENRYTVVPGDTLLGIALRFGLSWQTLAAANGLSERSLLQIGDVLVIPGSAVNTATTASTPATPALTHTVQSGETVWVIAARYAVDWRAILQANGLGEQSLLQIGQVLTLP